MRTVTYAEANRQFLPNLFASYKELTNEDLEVQIVVASHGSINPSCSGFFETARTAADAMWILRSATNYVHCPRCGGENDSHGVASIKLNVEVSVVT